MISAATVAGAFVLGASTLRARTARDNPLGVPLKEWANRLDRDAYRVLFEEGTERPHSSPLNGEKRPGTYLCVACKSPLFESFAKYDSGTGWPSFWRAMDGRVETRMDDVFMMPRTEYHCAHCGGHQGHVFGDGPQPTGERFCNNGVALVFIPEGETLPDRVEGVS